MNFALTEPLDALARVPGFRLAATACGIRAKAPNRLDLGLLFSEEASTTGAAVFTQNDFAAAPVVLSRQHLTASEGRLRGLVVNSGNANAATGDEGHRDADEMVRAAAAALGCDPLDLLVCSTGRIGDRLPLERVIRGLDDLSRITSADLDLRTEAERFSQAILTSDTRPKTVLLEGTFDGKPFTLAGVAKGAGMIQPNMATMLAFLITDLGVPATSLQESLRSSVNETFNRITIDGDESTNDTVVALANGRSGVKWSPDLQPVLNAALEAVCRRLALKIVGDGEKITRVVTVRVTAARTREQALKVARTIANSLLVKSSWYGGDPNWGRLIDAAGYAGAGLSWQGLELSFDDIPVIKHGQVLHENKEQWRACVNQPAFTVNLCLHQGKAEGEIWTTDLTEGYVHFNKSE